MYLFSAIVPKGFLRGLVHEYTCEVIAYVWYEVLKVHFVYERNSLIP